jgi:hypothetical protein
MWVVAISRYRQARDSLAISAADQKHPSRGVGLLRGGFDVSAGERKVLQGLGEMDWLGEATERVRRATLVLPSRFGARHRIPAVVVARASRH